MVIYYYFSMNVISLNCRGMCEVDKRGWVRDICSRQKPSVLGLQETKCTNLDDMNVASLWWSDDFGYAKVDAIGRSGGLLLIWDLGAVDIQRVFGDETFIAAMGRWIAKDQAIGWVNVYGPRQEKQREELWPKLERMINSDAGEWCIFGDFNEVRKKDERCNTQFSQKGADSFNEFINNNQLVDIPIGGTRFTRISDDGSKFSKLDRFLVSENFQEVMGGVVCTALDRRLSDHCPLLLKEDKMRDFGPKPFRTLDVWWNETGVDDIVKDAWRKPVSSCRPDCVFRDRLKNVKVELKNWSKQIFGALGNEIEECRKEVLKWEKEANERVLSSDENERWMEVRKVWLRKEKVKTGIMRQRARVKWAAEGDENSKLFHAAVRRRSRKGALMGLHVDGNWCEDPDVVKESVRGYFSKIFSEEDCNRPVFNSDNFKRLSMGDKQMLEMDFTEEEIRRAVNQCGSSKAPGPDGFNFRFIKRYWDILKGDIMRAIEGFWVSESISSGCNASFVSLIPKVSNPVSLNEFRPISLIGCFYKIVAKVLAERVKRVIDSVIGEEQSAFIQGRSILDGVLVANELIDFVKGRKKKSLIFKVDFEKAYDCINWNFLYSVMEQMGFGNKWIGWIRACLSSATTSVLVNGSPTKEICLSRGIRQGDPLSPFLFLIVAEGLNVVMKEVRESGSFKGVKLGDGSEMVSHLQFADDTIFFGEWSENNVVNLISLLKCFQLASGLKVNMRKSKLLGIGVDEEEVKLWADVIGCGVESVPFKYLGLSVGCSMKRSVAWNSVLDKFQRRLSDWKARMISQGGRLTLVKSVLGSLPLYFLSLYRAPIY